MSVAGKRTEKQRDLSLRVDLAYLVGLRRLGMTISFPPKLKVSGCRSGLLESVQRGRGLDFDEVRRYHPGDDIRAMDWRVMARTGQPHTRLYHEERDRPALFWADYRSAMYFGTRLRLKSVAVAEVATVLAWSVATAGDCVGGSVFNGKELFSSRPEHGKKGVLRYLHLLEKYAPDSWSITDSSLEGDSLEKALTAFVQPVVTGTVVVFAGNFHGWEERHFKRVALLSRRTEILLIQINDPIEFAVDVQGTFPVSDGNMVREWFLGGKDSVSELHQQLQKQRDQLRLFCLRNRIRLLNISTATSINKFALQFVESGINRNLVAGVFESGGLL